MSPANSNPKPQAAASRQPLYVVLTGNPNSGKTTLFNALTGLRAKVGNYAGVTVERKEGRLMGCPEGEDIRVLDLPGTYSLSPQSMDEQISRDVLLHRLPELPEPALVVVVVDGSNLQRNLYYTTQVLELGRPTLVALNMVDVAEANGHSIDIPALSRELGAPVIPLVASTGRGLAELKQRILESLKTPTNGASAKLFCELPATFHVELEILASKFSETFPGHRNQSKAEAMLLLSNEKALQTSLAYYPATIHESILASRAKLDTAGVDWRSVGIESRYACLTEISQRCVTETPQDQENFSDRVDKVLTHRVWGTLIFLAIMGFMFQCIFSFAKIPMDAMQSGVDWFANVVGHAIPPGDLNSLLTGGIIAGVGAVVVFLPQILLLFFFIGLLEDTGYMARAAFLMDRLMSKVGLHGKSFIPMLSSFACAIPGIMATRTIESPKDRLVTILVAPLMSCSARLPVYTLLIGACIPDQTIFGVIKLAGLTMLAMYLLGIVVALFMAWFFKKTLLKGEPPMLIMELPPYKRPMVKVVVRHMWDRSRLFLRRAGTVILGISILMWFLATYPRSAASEKQYLDTRHTVITSYLASSKATLQNEAEVEAMIQAAAQKEGAETNSPVELAYFNTLQKLDHEHSGDQLRNSFAGYAGRFIEPVIAPLGFDWKMGIGIIASFAAREVFNSTMSTVYNVGQYDHSDNAVVELSKTLAREKDASGNSVYTPLKAVSLMVFYVFALQCVSTVAVVRRETNGWKWPLFQWFYMGLLAWSLAFITYHGGHLLGFQ